MDGQGTSPANLAPPPALEAVDLTKTYCTSQGEVAAVAGVTMQAAQGEFVCIVGPSGCGKTTLLHLFAGLLEPTSGFVRTNGTEIRGPVRDIGLVFQSGNLMPWRTVLRNVTLPLEIQGVPLREAEDAARGVLDLVGLRGFENARPRELSGGMQQRVSIARALVYDPKILLLDEPFGALDALTRERMNLELQRIWQARRKTVIMVTHNIHEAVFLGDRVLVMTPRPGQISSETRIPLPRPRDLSVMSTPEFGALAQSIRASIYE
ncbi:MAG: ABC transporter ATP-binding protein [Anaerolineae bacterium]|nr:ABC transporter ATP-binding protein [Anaerolineae bacterium]